jgi:serine/threonine-protein kinase RsbW
MGKEIIHLDMPATHKYLHLAGACVGEMLSRVGGIHEPEQTIYNIQLAIQEGCSNIVDHAYSGEPGSLSITLILNDNPFTLTIELRDTGESFDPTSVEAPDLGVPQVRGYGMFIMRALMDEVVYESNAGTNCTRMIKWLSA